MQMVMSYLAHLAVCGEAERDGEGDVHRWRSIGTGASG